MSIYRSLMMMMIIVLLMGLHAVAQQDKPLPPVQPQASQAGTEADAQPEQAVLVPDTSPASGAQTPTLGSSERASNSLVPAVHVSEMADTNASNGRSNDLQSATAVSGSLELDRASHLGRLTLNYAAGGTFYSENSRSNSSYHSLGVSQKILGRRWSLLLSDNFSYSNGSGYGASGMAGISDYSLAGIKSSYLPNQTIITDRTGRLSNTSLGEVEHQVSARTSITLTGSYGFLNFLDSGFIDTKQINGSAGYNRALNPHDTLSATYSYMRFSFDVPGAHSIDSHAAQAQYSRRLTGRLSLLVGGGPQIIRYFVGQSEVVSPRGSAQGTVLYRVRRTDFSVGYTHGLTGGAGVFQGASTDAVQTSVSRTISKNWSMSTQFSYARNATLNGSSAFNSVYGGASVRRSIGRYAATSFSYNVQRQTASNAVCGTNCGDDLLRHVFGITFDWSFRPIRIQ